ncbi:hypothetical protein TREMEDRAFT_68179 [Tremella mesenterica DSM 1558]|uniref:uncharacterized protein n=1 Tax=Tremella mesenterica (strain ATCC 24925 / CBS 8224 / DSM 1558 / NBRC 9311 / NRRL Y-6157 / RJB 2259-6 / UBC 559-6) TaxID=578456 RepID=UPI0003F49EB7|nr:uncharacterized protein TREMEDRAFT_68179 [Tremella mesenterica DSM 1558]EIW70706.1 hypothetical protein TREMEDRAFT_68179 [Tremella mesenterica DSM 1558]
MSLYGGIKFGLDNGSSSVSPTSADPAPPPPPPSEVAPPGESVNDINVRMLIFTGPPPKGTTPPAAAAASSSAVQAAKMPKSTGPEFSASLKFAPRIAKTKTMIPRPTGPTTVYAALPVVRDSPPVSMTKEEVAFGTDGKPLERAPAMTLKMKPTRAELGKRGRDGDGSKKKKKKKKRLELPSMVVQLFDPEEQYDPNRPNDLAEYQQYRRRLKEEKRAKALAEKSRRMMGDSSSGSEYETDSEEEAPRRDAPKMFAPPRIYSPPASSKPLPLNPPQKTDVAMTGDDAYARRAAMVQASTGDDAYARRLALSQAKPQDQASVSAAELATMPSYPPPPPPEDAAPPPPSSSFIPPPAFALAAPSDPPVPIPQPPPSDIDKLIAEKRQAAQAIADKLTALAPKPAGELPPLEEGCVALIVCVTLLTTRSGGTWAERHMRRLGHKEGQGLGASSTGIVHALAAEHVVAPPKPADPNQPLSKRAVARQKAAAANEKNANRRWVQHGTNRGRIVNANEDERQRVEKERLGEASRVIVLTGIVDNEEEVDEELSEEIGEECSNYGIVERVVLHMAEPVPEDPSECLRIFIVYSGMAGAWRATRELDGRFFGGKKLRVRYFDEGRFDRGERDGPLI